MDATRAAVQNKRAKQGVDIHARGGEVAEAEAAADAAMASTPTATVAPTKPSEELMISSASTSLESGPSSSLAKVALQDNYATTPSKGMTRVCERQRAAERSNEVLGKK
ncbi:hypothetical protein RhiJN_19920 [Ceratobasidium sp. AG-Ba]|nr:hypothetical protein RhiJN_19920 [Ceratobasidium sp. AG-Ba]